MQAFPEVVDSTFIAAAKACQRKAQLSMIEHWKPQSESVHLVAGAAFARGLEVARRTFWDEPKLDEIDALSAGVAALIAEYGDFTPPDDSAKTLDRMVGALEFYFAEENFPLRRESGSGQADGRPRYVPGHGYAVEFSFAEPLEVLHPVTGNPLIYSGRADMIAEFAEGIYVWDDKTTSQLGMTWSQQWELRSQFSAYVWAAQRAGFLVNGVVANGVSILKTKYGAARAITNRSQWEIDRWMHEVERTLNWLIQSWREDDFAFNLDEACASYGGCAFRTVCKSPEPELWLPMYFERRVWDPLTRTETKLED